MICTANKLTGFYMKVTLVLNGLRQRKDYKVLLKNLQSATDWWMTKYNRNRLQSETGFDI